MTARAAATVVIVTKNRRDELRASVRSAVIQTALPNILVVDDGSNDGTSEMVRREFPNVSLVRFEQSRGYIVRRNQAASIARTPIIVSIDDDAAFSTPNTVAQTLLEFDASWIGAVAIPFVNVRADSIVRKRAPSRDRKWITDAFVGTAYAVRREMFLSLGGFRESFFHQCEERELCTRMLAAGFLTCLGSGDPVHHYESPRRSLQRIHVYSRRNDILYAWLNVPMPYLLIHIAGTVAKGVWYGIRVRRIPWMMQGVVSGFRACGEHWQQRSAVSSATYRLGRLLRARAAIPMEVLVQEGFVSPVGRTQPVAASHGCG
jgi:glycosyltransferase involved in cell wall biosynthesis